MPDSPLPRPPRDLARFFDDDGRLQQMPRRMDARTGVLAWIATGIPAGRELTENEVDNALSRYHGDVAMLRRFLVDHWMLERRPPGIYQRVTTTWSSAPPAPLEDGGALE